MLASTAFQREVLQDASETLYVYYTSPDGKEHVCELEHLQTKHVVGDIDMQSSTSGARHAIRTYIFKRPRDAKQNMYWNLFDVYKCLGKKGYGGQASSWVWHSSKSWGDSIRKHFDGNHMVLSRHGNIGDHKNTLPFAQRCLPFPCVDTVGLMQLLTYWAFSKHPSLVKDGCQVAAADLLRILVDEAFADCRPTNVQISCDRDWKCRWPRPSNDPDIESEVLQIDGQGGVYLHSFLQRSVCARGSTTGKWQAKLRGVFSVGKPTYVVPLAFDVMRKLEGLPTTQSFVAQLTWHVSKMLEVAVGAAMKAGSSPRPSFKFTLAQAWACWDDLDNVLYNYVQECKRQSAKHNSIIVSHDAANPCSGSTFNTILAWPDNVAAIGTPQVHGSRGEADNRQPQREHMLA